MKNNELAELYVIQPALAMCWDELKGILNGMTGIAKEKKEIASKMLNEVKENILLIASDSEETHKTGNCHCIVAIDAAEKLAAFLRNIRGNLH